MLSLQLLEGLEAGTDEAGRGCLAGPVTAAAVILPTDFDVPLLNDSKKLTEKQRQFLRPIIEDKAIAYAVAHCTPEEVDAINKCSGLYFFAISRIIFISAIRPFN